MKKLRLKKRNKEKPKNNKKKLLNDKRKAVGKQHRLGAHFQIPNFKSILPPI